MKKVYSPSPNKIRIATRLIEYMRRVNVALEKADSFLNENFIQELRQQELCDLVIELLDVPPRIKHGPKPSLDVEFRTGYDHDFVYNAIDNTWSGDGPSKFETAADAVKYIMEGALYGWNYRDDILRVCGQEAEVNV